MSIPIIILNKNRKVYTENLVDQFLQLGYDNITILDIASTYEPLLQWYKQCPVEVIYADDCGHKGLWEAGYIDRWSLYPWIAVTDSDIALNPNTPKGFIEQMITVAKDYRTDKVGLAIQYKDITNPVLKQIITPIESQYWKQKLVHDKYEVYNAPTDTTICIVRPQLPFQYHGVRIANWPITHMDWYSDWDNLTEEQLYYHINANPSIATGTKFYNEWLQKH